MRIGFWGNFGTLNLGNECTLAAAVWNMRSRLPQAQLTAICPGPADAAARHGIGGIAMSERRQPRDSRHLPKPLRILINIGREAGAWVRALRHASGIDALLITGSGILSDEGEGTLGLPYELFKWSLVTKLCRKKLFFVSVGAETLTRPLSQAFVKAALRLADYRSYRDVNSEQLLQRIGFRTDRDVVRPDMAFSLPMSVIPTAAAVESAPGALRRGRVAVGVFNYRDRGQGSSADAVVYRAYLDSICSLIQWLLAHDYGVRVVIGDFAYDEAVRLDVRAELVSRAAQLTPPAFCDEPATSFEQLLQQLVEVDFVIASRYHNVLLGLMLGKAVVSLSYELKHQAVMNDAGLGDYCQRLDDLNVGRLLQQFQRLASNADALLPTIVARAAANRASLEQQYDLIVSRICGPAAAGA
jgi:polysaccharide pyruvyl transferase WcaK-like protein